MFSPPLLALLNALRGSGRLPRWLFYPLAGLAVYLGTGSVLAACSAAGGLGLWLASGWHFDAVSGAYTLESPAKVRWINAACLRLLPRTPADGPARNRLRGTLWMALRGLHFYPAFLPLAWADPWALAWGLGVLLQGPCYWLGGRLSATHGVRVAEALTGLLFGTLIATAI